MLSVLAFPNITYGTLLGTCFCTSLNPLSIWLTFGKLPENPVVTPTSSTQVITPSAENRFLQSVTVNPIPVTPGT